jgi:hypothetical protein
MEKFNKVVIKLLKYFSPIFVVAVILAMNGYSGDNLFYDLIGSITVLWCSLAFYLFFAIAFNEKLKNAFVRRLAGIRENDEREFQITGVICKKTFISMTGILVLLLFLSALQVNVYKNDEAKTDDGKHGAIQIGMGMSILTSEKDKPQTSEESCRHYIIKYRGLPLTADGVLLVVMLLQLGLFYYFSKRENNLIDPI